MSAETEPSAGTTRKRGWKHIAKQFGIPKHHRFEIVFIRILFAYVLYQCMPLGAPYSHWGTEKLDALLPGDKAATSFVANHNEALRPPLPPISSLLPNSEGAMSFDVMKKPNGLAQFVDLTYFSDPDFVRTLPWVVIPCLILYVLGIGLPVALPLLTFVLLGARTLYNSQGFIHHGFQMVSLVLLTQTIVVLIYALKNPKEAFGFGEASGWINKDRTFWDVLVRYSQLMIIASYMIPGVVKQFKSGGKWFLNSHYIGVQVVKTHRQNFYNDLDPQWEPDKIPELANFMLERRNLTRLLLGAGVALQIIAFLALYNRLTTLIFGLLFVSFHYLNDIMFGLYFYHPEKMDWIFLINLPFWIWWIIRGWWKPSPGPESTPTLT